jgi:hypothetical protein
MESITRRGILVENGSGISFHDMKMDIQEGSALEAKDSKKISWDKISVTTAQPEVPFLKLTNCNDVTVTNCYQPENIPLFINEDEKSGNIIVANNILPGTSALLANKGINITTGNNILKK